VLAFALSACSTLVRVPEAPVAGRGGPPIEAYARVLERFVNDRGEVDFSALARDRADLDAYVIHVAGTPFGDFPAGHERLAHYINAYNALSMYNVLDSGIPETHAGWRKVRFFYLKELVIGGRLMSLYAFENDVIRKLGEPRVHFALNCSARGCPILPRAPFTARDLEEELDRETRRFFSEARNLRVDRAQRTVYVSELLDFYPEDFGPDLIGFVGRFSPEPIPPGYGVAFTEYDWTTADSRRSREVALLRPDASYDIGCVRNYREEIKKRDGGSCVVQTPGRVTRTGSGTLPRCWPRSARRSGGAGGV
jgi:hypothetical protein